MERQYDVHEAQAQFDRILEQVESGEEVVISRSGHPVARLVPMNHGADLRSRGTLRGRISIPEDFDNDHSPRPSR